MIARDHVLATPGARELITRTATQLHALAQEAPAGRLVRLTVACQGGRHRSVAVAEAIARRVWSQWDGAYRLRRDNRTLSACPRSLSTCGAESTVFCRTEP
ncbi:hypothetical protein ACIOUE_39000 [Streptomyces xanthochromogenes]|uniref:RapZ C-terminal domain-containing protein n=1 Tax=Streptomyces xanthochromogenes TaxID=67384 RepID=UPI0038057FA8